MSNSNDTTAQVTPELLAALVETEKFLAQYNDRNARLKDAQHYGAAAIQLETLVKAILMARTSVSLLGGPAIGPRFHVGSATGLMKSVDTATVYLTTVAGGLLRESRFNKYEAPHTTEVLSFLADLMSRITEDIRIVAGRDLRRISEKSVELLVATADVIAKIDGGDAASLEEIAKASAEPDREMIRAAINDTGTDPDADRCDVVLANTGRCVWPAGHLALNAPSECVGEDDPSRCGVDIGNGNRCLKLTGHLMVNPKGRHSSPWS